MQTPYPLRPVITSNAALRSQYNDHPQSIFMVSSCVTTQEVTRLLEQGASFESVILMDQVSDSMHARLAEQSAAVVESSQFADGFKGVDQIHAVLQRGGKTADDASAGFFMNAG